MELTDRLLCTAQVLVQGCKEQRHKNEQVRREERSGPGEEEEKGGRERECSNLLGVLQSEHIKHPIVEL